MKVLIIKLSALGDIISSTPVIKKILEHHSEDRVYLMTTPAFQSFFANWPDLHIKSLPRGGLINLFRQIRWVRQQRFDRIYDLQSNDRTGIICALSGCPTRCGNHASMAYHQHPETKYIGQCHSFQRLNEIISSAGLQPAEARPVLYPTTGDRDKVREWLARHGLKPGRFVIMHAGSSPQHPMKRWPYFAELAEHVAAAGYTIIWIGARDEVQLNKQLSQSTGIDATNEFSILELIELGHHAAFAITNDSAPMHILSCSGIPVFGLFGPTNPRRTHALGQENRVIFAGDNWPDNDMDFSPADIKNISVDQVKERLKMEKLIS